MSKCLYLLVGKSGAGKSCIRDGVCSALGLIPVESYTSRPRRSPNEGGHIYITKEDFENIVGVIAFNVYKGEYYCTDMRTLLDSDIYVVEPSGVVDVMQRVSCLREVRVIYVRVPVDELILRLTARGDDLCDIYEKLREDEGSDDFMINSASIVIDNEELPRAIEEVVQYIVRTEKELKAIS